jgi:H+/Cl- antiporter ClcA
MRVTDDSGGLTGGRGRGARFRGAGGPAAVAAPRPDLVPWLKLVLLSAAFAVPAALVSGLFIVVVRFLTDAAWVQLPEAVAIPEPALLLAVPIVGSLVVGLIVRFAPGHGGPDPATEHGLGGHPGTLRELPGTVGAAAVSLASGASLGPEGPLVGILGTLGAATAGALRLPPEAGRVLGIAGLSSLLGGIFGNPLAVGLFLVEMSPVAGRELYRRIIPALVAATVGVFVFSLIAGGLFAELHFPAYEGLQPWHLAVAVAFGAGGAVLGMAYVQLVKLVRLVLRPLDSMVIAKLLVGGVAIGLIAVVFGQLTLFSGEHEISEVIAQGESMGLAALPFLAVGKVLAAAVSLSTGFRGGRIFPVLFSGGTLGMAVHVAFPAIPAALAVSTGMAGIGVTVLRAPLFLVTFLGIFTSPEMIPLMLLAAITVWILMDGREEL